MATNVGKELHLTAARPLSAYVDGDRIRLEARATDGSEIFLWLNKDDFAASLDILRFGARQIGTKWPPALPQQ